MASHRIIDNKDERFPGCVCIETVEDDGTVSSRSWAPADVDPAIRMNVDVAALGPCEDARSDTETTEVAYRVPTVDEFCQLHGIGKRAYAAEDDPVPGCEPVPSPKEGHKVLATYAAVVEAVPLKDAAKAVELPEKDLTDEALAWEAKRAIDAAEPTKP